MITKKFADDLLTNERAKLMSQTSISSKSMDYLRFLKQVILLLEHNPSRDFLDSQRQKLLKELSFIKDQIKFRTRDLSPQNQISVANNIKTKYEYHKLQYQLRVLNFILN